MKTTSSNENWYTVLALERKGFCRISSGSLLQYSCNPVFHKDKYIMHNKGTFLKMTAILHLFGADIRIA